MPAYGPGASVADVAPASTPRQGQLPEEYKLAGDAELDARIRAAKAALGDRAVVLGHFYQRDEVIEYADFVGDSFQLANAALTRPDAEAIVFCGVHFMAETADILSRPDQAVILPNLAAGCSMADMADIDSVTECWEQLEELYGTEPDADGRVPVIPVTYMNSSAALKGFCGEHGGIVCTSSNAATVLEWAFERGQRVLFFPDQHLGRNTAKAMGVPLEQMPMWNPRKDLGGNAERDPARFPRDPLARLLLGPPALHRRPDREGPRRVPGRAGDRAPGMPDGSGGRRRFRRVHGLHPQGHRRRHRSPPRSRSAPRSTWSTGWPRSTRSTPIFCLDPVICPCSTMYRIHPGYLAWVLEALVRGEVVNRITVADDVAAPAKVALERMLAARP